MTQIFSKIWMSWCFQDFKNGLPIGHKSINLSKGKFWHPLMIKYIIGIRNNIAILNLSLTKKALLRAFYAIALLFRGNGHLLIINTNPEYFILNKNLSLLTLQQHTTKNLKFQHSQNLYSKKISYCSYKWVGGTLTNWKQISKSVLTFAKFSQRCERFLLKTNIDFPRYKKIKKCFQGLLIREKKHTVLAFYEKPDLIFLLNPNENQNIISEANKLHIPIIALAESNTNITGITYPIPVNVYSINFVYYCLKKIIKFSKNFT